MPIITEVVDIKAAPEKVFDLIARPEGFPKYSRLVKKVTATGSAIYHWIIDIFGIELEWDAKVVEMVRPKRFAWKSIKGIQNAGSYRLKPIEGGTRVAFSMEYHLPNAILEKLAHLIAGSFMERIASELMENVKKELENS